ncbi:unnamed protein product [Clonostachys rosea]|uniref:NAD-dependent epimerase/dehydratase domain-containing protein n=1 Tax=Bionectria ochroleuca TaxID=29856 RepID=A0ABY6U1Q5_BIOOC|nr:unnamed protein product [Clonostachys rosea]
MSKVLVTGGSGFIAAHVLNVLLSRGHTVVTTVRSAAKGDQILAAHSDVTQGRLSYVIVEDIAKGDAFDDAVESDPPFDYVIHTASPFHHKFDDPVKDILEPAINGTTGILRAIKAKAPNVKRVVITSSFAAVANADSPPAIYDGSSWNPVTWEEAVAVRTKTYRGSKTFAERAAWEFVDKEKPNFDLATVNPPLVYGPIAHHLESLDKLNTSNQRIRDLIQGKYTNEMPPTGSFIFTDVRDLALAHVRAIEVPEAGGKRFLITAGHYSNKQIVELMRETHPELASRLPADPIDDFPKNVYGYDNSAAREVLGIKFRSLKECVNDTTASLLALGAYST